MNRVLVGGAAGGVVLAGVLASRAARGCCGQDVRRMIRHVPENAPRKSLVRNIDAIRRNTERILELLETERAPRREESLRTAV